MVEYTYIYIIYTLYTFNIYIFFIVTLPETLYNVETGRISVNSTKRIRFLVKALPVSITFAIFNE